jgi:hypothetical protein
VREQIIPSPHYDMNLALIAAINFMMNGFKKKPKGKQSKEFKKEVEKINEMGLFESINYVKNKK